MEASQATTSPLIFTNYQNQSQNFSAPSAETLPIAQEQIKSFASMWQRLEGGEILTAKDKKNAFIFDCKRLAETENLKAEKTAHSVRIATFNVHVWADPHFQWRKEDVSPEFSGLCRSLRIPETTKISPIFDTVRALNADILLLQEAASDNNAEFEDYKRILQELGYTHGIQFFGNMNKDREVPYGPFGNWILSKFPFAQDPKVTYYTTQMEHTPEGEYVDRCVINGTIVLPNGQTVSIYNTHLDVFDHTEEVRTRQIQQLTDMVKEDYSDNIFIAGDLNSVRPQDYSEPLWNAIIHENQKRKEETPYIVSDHLKSEGFVDCFTMNSQETPGFTTWSGTTIDFIMPKRDSWNLPIKSSGVFYSPESDHIPVYMDLDMSNKNTGV